MNEWFYGQLLDMVILGAYYRSVTKNLKIKDNHQPKDNYQPKLSGKSD